MTVVALVLLVLAAVGFLVRALLGPTLSDRVVALDGLVVCLVGAVMVQSVRGGDGLVVDVALVVSLVGFIGTSAAARFVERRGN